MNDYDEYEKRAAQQKRYEQTLDLIIWCGFLALIVWVLCGWF